MMKAPRRPRGEHPTTTIRVQARQITTLQQTIDGLRGCLHDKEAVITGYDVQLREANEDCSRLRRRSAHQAAIISDLQSRNRHLSERLSFLEGYYAKSQETLSMEKVPFPSGILPGNTAQVEAVGRPGNQAHYQNQLARTAAFKNPPPGSNEGFGAEVQRQSAYYKAHQAERPVEHVKINGDPPF